MGALLSSLLESFYVKHMEIALVGLENAGKTTLLNVLSGGEAGETVPTIGLNVTTVKKGNVLIKCWDLAGQSKYRSEWGRYARGVDCIIFVVDAADPDRLPIARRELHRMLEDTSLANTPILIAANKVDVTPHVSEKELISQLNLDYVVDQPWIVMPCSATAKTNIDVLLKWLMEQRKGEATRASSAGAAAAASVGGAGTGTVGGRA